MRTNLNFLRDAHFNWAIRGHSRLLCICLQKEFIAYGLQRTWTAEAFDTLGPEGIRFIIVPIKNSHKSTVYIVAIKFSPIFSTQALNIVTVTRNA